MKIISIAAPGNGSGKTLTARRILGAFPGRLAAVKFTTVFRDGVNCPRTEKACACRTLHGRYTIVTDPDVLATEQTDTGLLTRSGARRVLWCLAQPGAHGEAWAHLREDLLAGEEALITEGNTAIPVLDPDLLVMVMSPRLDRARWKPDTWDLARRADFVIVNRYAASEEEIRLLAAEVAAARDGRQPAAEDVSLPIDEWSEPSVRDAVARLLGAA